MVKKRWRMEGFNGNTSSQVSSQVVATFFSTSQYCWCRCITHFSLQLLKVDSSPSSPATTNGMSTYFPLSGSFQLSVMGSYIVGSQKLKLKVIEAVSIYSVVYYQEKQLFTFAQNLQLSWLNWWLLGERFGQINLTVDQHLENRWLPLNSVPDVTCFCLFSFCRKALIPKLHLSHFELPVTTRSQCWQILLNLSQISQLGPINYKGRF